MLVVCLPKIAQSFDGCSFGKVIRTEPQRVAVGQRLIGLDMPTASFGIIRLKCKLYLVVRTRPFVTINRLIVVEGGGDGHIDCGFVGATYRDETIADDLVTAPIPHDGTSEITQTASQFLMSTGHAMQSDAFGCTIEAAVLLRRRQGGSEVELPGLGGS